MCLRLLRIAIVCALVSPVFGQWDSESAFGAAQSDSADVSIPTVSGGLDTDNYDWLILTSGEMLKGEIKEMFDGELLFDSDILGDVSIDWDDIKEIRSTRPMSLRLNRRETISGTIKFEGEDIAVESADGTVTTVNRNNVVSMVQDHKSELENWSFEVGVGVNIQRGNTNETAYSANISAVRQTALTRYTFNYLGNYTRTNGTTTTSNQLINTYFDYYLDKQIFIRPAFAQYYKDPFQNLEYQITVGAGIGYQIMDTSTFDWEVVAGPVYQMTGYDSVPAGQPQSVRSPGALVQTTYSYDITGDLTLDGDYQVTVTERSSGLINGNFNTTLTYEINDLLDINTSFIWNYIAYPAETSSGETPSPSDMQLIFGIGLSY